MGYFITVEPGVKLYVEDVNPEGNKTILFIHGWPLNYKQFEYQFDVLPAMGYRCIGIDWRGFGNSDKPFDGYNFDRLADDIRAVVGAFAVKRLHTSRALYRRSDLDSIYRSISRLWSIQTCPYEYSTPATYLRLRIG